MAIAILYADGGCQRTLTLARLGILPFFWLLSVLVTSLPPVLAHAGLTWR